MKKLTLLCLLFSVIASAGSVCPDITLCQDQIAAVQAQQAVADRQAALRIAAVQAAINAMPSPTPSASP